MLQFFLLKSPHSKHVGHTVLERVRCLYCFSFVGILPIREKRPSRESIEMNFLGENMNRFKLSTLAGGILSACIATTGFAAEMEEVVVTGSFIKGSPEDAALPVDVLSRSDLEDVGNPTIIEMIRIATINSDRYKSVKYSNASNMAQVYIIFLHYKCANMFLHSLFK